MYFNLAKVGRNRTNVYDLASGEMLCQLLNKEVDDWIYRATKARDNDAVYARERRERRLEIARDYLSARKTRPVQMSMF